jgi:Mg-chelatase subunit ChlD
MSMPELRSRRSASKGWVLSAILIPVVLFATARCGGPRAPGDESADTSAAEPGAKYVSSVDEGLGASIALVLDVSGSMKDKAEGDSRPKYIVAREALQAMLETTDSFVARQPDFPVNVGLYTFSGTVKRVVPVKPYNREELQSALASLGRPSGGTAIGDAMEVAREDLYRAGTFRKYILVVTDGENTDGRSPAVVAREIAARSEGAVRQYFVAFNIDKKRFAFLEEVNGEVLGAANGLALRASLDSIYRGKILAEAMNAGETAPPDRRDSGGVPRSPPQ